MEFFVELLISALLVIAGVFGVIASLGLLKLPTTITRLHAPTMAATLGVAGVLIASMLYFLVFEQKPSWHELLITLFILLTAPITANFIAKAHLHKNDKEDTLPPTGVERNWATFDDEEEPSEPVLTQPRKA